MIVTTVRKNADVLVEKAKDWNRVLSGQLVNRNDRSVQDLINEYNEDVLVVGRDKVTLHSVNGGEPFFYHPNSAMFRVKQFLKTGYDPLVQTAQLQRGMSFLDCTLGLGSDSLVAQLAVGEQGLVRGIEANQALANLVRHGLQTWQEGQKEMLDAMKRIEVIHEDHFSYLASQPSNSFDIVYFDPMFDTHISDSSGIQGLKQFACHDDLDEHVIKEALRVAKERIVLKDHYLSKRFKRFGFEVIKRQHASFHYGWLDKKT
ncbi:class I SAM-dependent methyltransferase [Halalkalibacter krulwichiae]|uniref:Putative methyltransferase n=1 Tax=Halalkalibacter krulwichiae TaxID=199441 RepID=A0A1X9MBX3_9BACI|nr:class I SAM-dependent methyltransferase [Halalkalibacter krulwichiae]ARK30917.1 putative methyltransferase [Halalkalibacter krulwichiae]